MTLRNILVHVADDGRDRDRAAAACELARRHDADVTGLYVRPYPVIIPAAPIGGAVPIVEGLSEAYDRAASEGRIRFEEVAGQAGVRAGWQVDDGDAAERIAVHARYADLAVVGQWSPDETPEMQARDLGALVALSAGRPVLVMPYAGNPGLEMRRVMLCWDGSREAARAAHDMISLVPSDARVEVVCVDPDEAASRDPGADIARHLAGHGLTVDAHRMSRGDISIADALISASADLGSDLVVMGAYGHARMREIAFGGTTRAMLEQCPLPLMLAH